MNWNTYTLSLSDLDLDINEIYLNLGYGGEIPEDSFVEMIDKLINHIGSFCKPSAGYLVLPGKIADKNYLEIYNIRIKVGSVITKYLKNATHFAIFVVTAGEEFDTYLEQLRADGDIVSEFLVYSIGSEIAEATVRFITAKITEEADKQGFMISHSYSPGHCSWHVCEQQKLFSLLPEKPCGVELNESSLMHPVKSVSGILGLGKDLEMSLYGCDICGLKSCFKRKTTN